MQETRVRSLAREDPLEKEMTTHSNTPAWRIPWTEELGKLQSRGPQRQKVCDLLTFHLGSHSGAVARNIKREWLSQTVGGVLELRRFSLRGPEAVPGV